MPTIKDVAKHAGVSIATVSRVLNNKGVKTETKKEVLEVIAKLGYRVNMVARSLKTNKTQTIGFLVPDFGPFFMEVAQVVEEILNDYGYSLIVCSSNEDFDREHERIAMLKEKQVDGIIVVPTSERADHLLEIQSEGTPIVLVDRIIPDFWADCVLVDNVNGSYLAVEHLVNQGYERIGLINGRQEVTTGKERHRGFRRVFEDYNMTVSEDLIMAGDFSTESGYDLMKKLLELPNPPEAIFVANYYMSIGALLAINELGVNVPESLGLVVFDSMDLSKLANPPLTAVIQPLKDIGEKVAHLIYKRVRGDNSDFPQLLRLKPELVVRQSSKMIRLRNS